MSGSTTSGRVGARPAFWLVAYAFAATMLGTTLPTPLYPAYEAVFGFGSVTVTVVFAMYAVGVLAALLAVGRASDTVGRRPVLLAGLIASTLSAVTFLIVGGLESGGVPLLLVGRVLSGLSAGIFTGTATATLLDFAKPGRHVQASVTAAVVNVAGLGLGPLVSGLLARYVDAPLRTAFAVHLGLLALAFVAIAVIPETVHVTGPRRLRVQRLVVPAQVRRVMAQAGTAGFAGFAVLGLFTAVTPAVLALLGHHNPALTGIVVFVVFAACAVAPLLSTRLPTRRALLIGSTGLIIGISLVGISLGASSLALLVIGGLIAGAGQGVSVRAALGTVTAASPVDLRGSVASTFFAICYVGISIPVVGIGIGAKLYGLVHTGEVFAALVALLSLAALISFARSPRADAVPE